jgi:hypothetical protein
MPVCPHSCPAGRFFQAAGPASHDHGGGDTGSDRGGGGRGLRSIGSLGPGGGSPSLAHAGSGGSRAGGARKHGVCGAGDRASPSWRHEREGEVEADGDGAAVPGDQEDEAQQLLAGSERWGRLALVVTQPLAQLARRCYRAWKARYPKVDAATVPAARLAGRGASGLETTGGTAGGASQAQAQQLQGPLWSMDVRLKALVPALAVPPALILQACATSIPTRASAHARAKLVRVA